MDFLVIEFLICRRLFTKHFPTATTAITLPDYSIKQRGEDVCLPSLFWLTNAAVTQCHFRCELDSDPMVGRAVAARAFNVDPGNVVHLWLLSQKHVMVLSFQGHWFYTWGEMEEWGISGTPRREGLGEKEETRMRCMRKTAVSPRKWNARHSLLRELKSHKLYLFHILNHFLIYF